LSRHSRLISGTADSVHEANHFDFHPVKEVAILFAGIFATMMPALDWLQTNAGKIGQPTESLFFGAVGCFPVCWTMRQPT